MKNQNPDGNSLLTEKPKIEYPLKGMMDAKME